MNKKQILFLSPLPPPYYGSAISSQTCMNVLKSCNDYDVIKIRLNYSRSFSDLEKLSFRKIAGYLYTFFLVLKYSLSKKPALVYIMPATTGMAFIRDFSLALMMKLFHGNILFHLRTQIHESQKKSLVKGFIFRKAFKNSKIIVLGEELKEGIKEYFSSEQIFILPNAIQGNLEENEFTAIQEKRKTEDSIRLLFISNMIASKGWKKTLEAAKILHNNNHNFHLKFAGSWPSKKEEDEFNSLIEEYKLQKQVSYLGYINKEQKKKIFSHSDVLVFPTEYSNEALPRVIIEAYEYGLPVISTRNGSIPSMIVHNKTGFLLHDITAQEIANFLVKLSDKNKLLEMGKDARDIFKEKYELSVFSKNFLAIIKKCL